MTSDQSGTAQWSAESTDDNPVPLIDPQPVIDELLALHAEVAGLETELAGLKRMVRGVNMETEAESDRLQAQVDRMQPVVEAARLHANDETPVGHLRMALATLDKAQQAGG